MTRSPNPNRSTTPRGFAIYDQFTETSGWRMSKWKTAAVLTGSVLFMIGLLWVAFRLEAVLT